jgi:hypothetical protein
MNKRILSTPTPRGYKFMLNSVVIGEGEYDKGVFLLIDDSDVTEHRNGMAALHHLTRKHLPDYYARPVKNNPFVAPAPISNFKHHPALKGVTKEVMFAK